MKSLMEEMKRTRKSRMEKNPVRDWEDELHGFLQNIEKRHKVKLCLERHGLGRSLELYDLYTRGLGGGWSGWRRNAS